MFNIGERIIPLANGCLDPGQEVYDIIGGHFDLGVLEVLGILEQGETDLGLSLQDPLDVLPDVVGLAVFPE